MAISRRTFLSATSAAAAALVGIRSRTLQPFPARGDEQKVCGLIDLEGNCLVRESFEGYRAALPHTRLDSASPPEAWAACGFLIVPATAIIGPEVAERISCALRNGKCVLLESAMGFLEDPEFVRAQGSLAKYFDVSVAQRVDLWSCARRRVPYVDFTWPRPNKVRDFSRVVTVPSRADEVIARIDGIPVGMRRRFGRGTLIVLGSLLGPSLLAGDRESRNWLDGVFLHA